MKKKTELENHLDQQLSFPKREVITAAQRRYEDNFEEIFLAYTQPEKFVLSEKLERQVARWKYARELISMEGIDISSNRDLCNYLMAEYEISERQAYIDIKNMQKFFEAADQTNLEFEKILHLERVKRHISKAEALGEKGLRMLSPLNKELSNILGIGKDHHKVPAPTNVTIVVQNNPELAGGTRVDDLDNKVELAIQKAKLKREKSYQDVDFEEIDE